MSQPEEIILDDGQYFVELNSNYPLKDAPGMLLRRRARSDTTPGGNECIGSFDKRLDGQWNADVTVPYDPVRDVECHVLAEGVDRMDAIVALWTGRRMAV